MRVWLHELVRGWFPILSQCAVPTAATRDSIPAGDDPDWQESAYLAWRDPVAGLGGNHRIGNELNRGTANLWCGVYPDAGDRFRSNGEGLDLLRLDGHGLVRVRNASSMTANDCASNWTGMAAASISKSTTPGPGLRERADVYRHAGTAGTIFSNNFHVFCRVRGPSRSTGIVESGRAGVARPLLGGAALGQLCLEPEFRGEHGRALTRSGSVSPPWWGRTAASSASVAQPRRRTRAVASAEMRVHVDDDSVRCPAAEVRYLLEDGGAITVHIETIGGMIGATRSASAGSPSAT